MLDSLFGNISDANTGFLTGNTEASDRKHRRIHQKHRRKRAGNTDVSLPVLTGNTEVVDRKHRMCDARSDQKHRYQIPDIDRKHRSREFRVLARFVFILTRNTEWLLTRNTESK